MDAIFRALEPVAPAGAMAAAASVHIVNAQGTRADGSLWSMLEVTMGAGGDGLPFMIHGQSGWERNVEGYAWVSGADPPLRSASRRRWARSLARWCRSGQGNRVPAGCILTLRGTDRCERPPLGLAGGGSGTGGGWILNSGRPDERALLSKATNLSIRAGDVLTVLVPGSGGYGDPADRDPEAITHDRAEGLVSADRGCSGAHRRRRRHRWDVHRSRHCSRGHGRLSDGQNADDA